MKQILTLWKREFAAYFLSPMGYITMVFFLALMGISFWMLVAVLAQGTEGIAVVRILFGESIFFWLAMIMSAPLITMRLFAEEKRIGTIETLMTAPVTDVQVVLAKYLGALSYFVILWLPTIAYAFILEPFNPLPQTLDRGPLLGAYLGIFLIGSFYLSIGLFASSTTNSQMVAAITTFAVLCAVFFAGFTPFYAQTAAVQETMRYFSSLVHMMDFSRGAVDTRPVVLYVSATVLMLFLTVKVVESRKWK